MLDIDLASADLPQSDRPAHYPRVADLVEQDIQSTDATDQQRIASIITRAQAAFIGSNDRARTFTELLDNIVGHAGAEFGILHEVALPSAEGAHARDDRAFVEVARSQASARTATVQADAALWIDMLLLVLHRVRATRQPEVVDFEADDLPLQRADIAPHVQAKLLVMPIEHDEEIIGILTLVADASVLSLHSLEPLRPICSLLAQLLDVWRTTRLRRQDQRSIARLSQVAQQMQHGMVIISADGRIDWVNDAFTHDLAVADVDVLGQRPADLYAALEIESADGSSLPALLSLGEPFAGEFRIRRVDTDRDMWFQITASPFINSSGSPEGLILMTTDISERRRIERMKDDFISTVSHELRTPLTSISGALSLLSSGVGGVLEGPVLDMVSIAHRNSGRLTRLIDDLLDLDKLAAGKLRIDLEIRPIMELVDEACLENQVYADGYGVNIECLTRADVAHVEVDPQRFQQVLRNLLSNAAKFSKAGDQVELHVVAGERIVQVQVIDHGIGIPAEFFPLIFQKFTQAGPPNRQSVGTGLGLAISKDLVERMGGLIDFQSEACKGSTFTVTLPRCQPRQA